MTLPTFDGSATGQAETTDFDRARGGHVDLETDIQETAKRL
jgi:hypothetical protein